MTFFYVVFVWMTSRDIDSPNDQNIEPIAISYLHV